MLGIKKMLKDDGATGILGAVGGSLLGSLPGLLCAIPSGMIGILLGCLGGILADILAPVFGCCAGCCLGFPACGGLLGGIGGAGLGCISLTSWVAVLGGLAGAFIDYMAMCLAMCGPILGALCVPCNLIAALPTSMIYAALGCGGAAGTAGLGALSNMVTSGLKM